MIIMNEILKKNLFKFEFRSIERSHKISSVLSIKDYFILNTNKIRQCFLLYLESILRKETM